MEKIAEILYQAYMEKYALKYIELPELDEIEHKFIETLSSEQHRLYLDLECCYIDYRRLNEIRAIQYVLELIYPKEDY